MNKVKCWMGYHQPKYNFDNITTIIKEVTTSVGRDTWYKQVTYEVAYCSNCEKELSRFVAQN